MNRTLSMRWPFYVAIALAISGPRPVWGADFPVNLNLTLLPAQITGFGEQRWESGILPFNAVALTPGDTATIHVTFDKLLVIEDTLLSENEFIYFRVDSFGGPGGIPLDQPFNYRWTWIKPTTKPVMANPFFGTGCLSVNNGIGVITAPGPFGCQLVDGVLDITNGKLGVCGIELRVQAPPGIAGPWRVDKIQFALQADEISIALKPDDIPTLSLLGISVLVFALLFAAWSILRKQSTG